MAVLFTITPPVFICGEAQGSQRGRKGLSECAARSLSWPAKQDALLRVPAAAPEQASPFSPFAYSKACQSHMCMQPGLKISYFGTEPGHSGDPCRPPKRTRISSKKEATALAMVSSLQKAATAWKRETDLQRAGGEGGRQGAGARGAVEGSKRGVLFIPG